MMMEKRQFKRRKRKTADPAGSEPLSPTPRAEPKPATAPEARREPPKAPVPLPQPPEAPAAAPRPAVPAETDQSRRPAATQRLREAIRKGETSSGSDREATAAAERQERHPEQARAAVPVPSPEPARRLAAPGEAPTDQRSPNLRDAAAHPPAAEPAPAEAAPQVTAPENTPADQPSPDDQLNATQPAKPATARSEPARQAPAVPSVDQAWARIRTMPIDPRHLEGQRVIAASRKDPAHMAFDVLRTRLIQALAERGWRRVAITSPTKDCGKTFTAANLAVSLSRQENCRTVLLDFDMRNPSLHKVFGLPHPGSIGDLLRGTTTVQDHFRRMGQNTLHIGRTLALACNDRVEPYASELLQEPGAIEAIRRMEALLDPTVVLFDMPPALYHDDVIAFRPHIDGVLLVVGGGRTRPSEIRDVQRRLGNDTPLLGVVLNTAEGPTISHYSY